MESLAALVAVMLATMPVAAVGGLLLSGSNRLELRVAGMAFAVIAFGLGVLLATRVDSLGALLIGWACAAAGVVAAVRALRRRAVGVGNRPARPDEL